MKIWVTAAALIMAAGCVHTPQEVLESGHLSTIQLKHSGAAAARCLQTNAENMHGTIVADRRPGASGERVIVRATGQAPGVLAVVDVGDGGPTKVALWQYIFGDRDDFIRRLTDGC